MSTLADPRTDDYAPVTLLWAAELDDLYKTHRKGSTAAREEEGTLRFRFDLAFPNVDRKAALAEAERQVS
jgi:hypothetical protein